MNIEEWMERGVTSGNSPQPGVANYPPQSVIGFHQPISPSAPPLPPQFHSHGYQAGQAAPPLPSQFYSHGYQAGQAAPPVPPHGYQAGQAVPPLPPQFYAHGYQAGQAAPPLPPQFYAHGNQAGQGPNSLSLSLYARVFAYAYSSSSPCSPAAALLTLLGAGRPPDITAGCIRLGVTVSGGSGVQWSRDEWSPASYCSWA
ncbi:hypothetical protein RHGRI_018220 [Rhododendron griersonianum]|uniref:Uncharacterized protein n=1 Tax=Rhododendron griersonianum TaxID=479676 RepID=A0AAV6K0M9_9ERIC|nr:hypothetical protein RHGRI_018220 [Rhododendron griersonianum]